MINWKVTMVTISCFFSVVMVKLMVVYRREYECRRIDRWEEKKKRIYKWLMYSLFLSAAFFSHLMSAGVDLINICTY